MVMIYYSYGTVLQDLLMPAQTVCRPSAKSIMSHCIPIVHVELREKGRSHIRCALLRLACVFTSAAQQRAAQRMCEQPTIL